MRAYMYTDTRGKGGKSKETEGKRVKEIAFSIGLFDPASGRGGEANGRLCMKMVIALCFLLNPIRAAAGFPKMRQDDGVSTRRIKNMGAGKKESM